MTACVELTQGSVQFGYGAHAVRALERVSVRIMPGERIALVGANGSGKSCLLRVLNGVLTLSAGTRRSGDCSQALLYQRPYLLRLSVLRNVALGPWLRGVPWAQARIRALEALHAVGMAEQADRAAHTLSGGQQQRVAMARAWACSPQMLLLDEPSANLDPHAKREVEALMQQFCDARPDLTLVFASHNLGQVKRLASRVLYLERGALMADLPVDTFFRGDTLEREYPGAHRFVRGEVV